MSKFSIFTKQNLSNKKFSFQHIFSNMEFLLLSLPVFIYLFIFSYIPMAGLILAFKDYRYDLGILKSKWVGLDNFHFFFSSLDAWRITRNTVVYGVLFIILNAVFGVLLALLLYEITNKFALKTFQTVFMLPNFLSWVLIAFVVYLFLNPESGIIASIQSSFRIESFDWYTKPKYWPIIIPLVNTWKNIGWISLIYYASLMSVSKELFESAAIDGAGKLRQIWSISIPSIMPVIISLSLIFVGTSLIRSDFGLFYQIPRNSGLLFSTTDVIDTYVFRVISKIGDIGMATAVSVYQSFVSLALLIISNLIIKKLHPESAIF